MMKKKVVVAMSGGIDSSMTAKRVVDAGHEAYGVYLRLHNNEESHAVNIANIDTNRAVPVVTPKTSSAKGLEIPITIRPVNVPNINVNHKEKNFRLFIIFFQ